MLFRVLTLCLTAFIALGVVTQVIWPALRGRAVFPLFRKESRLARAERLRIEALQEKAAAEREGQALRARMEAEETDAELTRELLIEERKRR